MPQKARKMKNLKLTEAVFDEVLGICKECGFGLTSVEEMLPDYPDLYECPECNYPTLIENKKNG